MDAIEKLKFEARQKRDRAIKQAKADYSATLKAIRIAARKLRGPQTQSRVRRPESDEFDQMSAVAAAEVVLRERGPLTLYELAAEIQARGCRSGDDPRKLVENLRASMRYHVERFVRGEDGRWATSPVRLY